MQKEKLRNAEWVTQFHFLEKLRKNSNPLFTNTHSQGSGSNQYGFVKIKILSNPFNFLLQTGSVCRGSRSCDFTGLYWSLWHSSFKLEKSHLEEIDTREVQNWFKNDTWVGLGNRLDCAICKYCVWLSMVQVWFHCMFSWSKQMMGQRWYSQVTPSWERQREYWREALECRKDADSLGKGEKRQDEM